MGLDPVGVCLLLVWGAWLKCTQPLPEQPGDQARLEKGVEGKGANRIRPVAFLREKWWTSSDIRSQPSSPHLGC